MELMTKENKLEGKIGIYKLTNTRNLKVYIGSSVNIRKRINSHIRKLHENNHGNKDLQKDWNIYASESFSYEVIEFVDFAYNLPELEKKYIEEYKSADGVYNKNDPTADEYIKNRYERNTGRNTKPQSEYKITQKYILNYLEENYKDKMDALHNHIGERIYYSKNQVDKWFMKNIENEDVRTDERLEGLLTRWYRSNGFSIIVSPLLKKCLKEYGVDEIPIDDMIITQDLYSKINTKPVRKKRKQFNK